MAIASTYFTENCAQLGQYIKSLDNQIAELQQKKTVALRAFNASKGAEAISTSLNLEVDDV